MITIAKPIKVFPMNILIKKKSINVYLSELIILINNCFMKGVFNDDLKLADITPMFKDEV